MDLAHSEITLAGVKIDLPPLKLGQIRRIKDAVVRGRELRTCSGRKALVS